jgi:hypothetical protein
MKVEVLKEKTFEPRYRGNLKLPESERIRVFHRFLTPDERSRYIYTKPMDIGSKSDGRIDYVQDEKGITKAIVTKIENYSIISDGIEVKIDTADKLYTTPGVSPNLIVEIESYCLLASPEVQKVPLE